MPRQNDKLGQAVQTALNLMRDSGYEIKGRIEASADPKLPFMGYSTQREGHHVIVVSGAPLKSGPIEGLLIHEMCHIYRTESGHFSHNNQLLNRVGTRVIHENSLDKDYQIRIIQQAVNHVQDLYADDLAFQVFRKGGAFTPEQAHSFFLEWINDTPIKEKNSKDRWQNVGIMLNNCFAVSNLARHRIPDIGNQVENAVQRFLSKVDTGMRSEFPDFRGFMTSLSENSTQERFERDLAEYLTRIAGLAKQQRSH
jgi:hypothetical protein